MSSNKDKAADRSARVSHKLLTELVRIITPLVAGNYEQWQHLSETTELHLALTQEEYFKARLIKFYPSDSPSGRKASEQTLHDRPFDAYLLLLALRVQSLLWKNKRLKDEPLLEQLTKSAKQLNETSQAVRKVIKNVDRLKSREIVEQLSGPALDDVLRTQPKLNAALLEVLTTASKTKALEQLFAPAPGLDI